MRAVILPMPPHQCPTNKMPFATRGEAAAFARTRAKYGSKQEPYRCRRCPAWHLTSLGHRP